MKLGNFVKSFHFKFFLLLFAVSAYLVFTWFPGGKIIAGGDVGIPVWAPSKQLAEVASSWWESHATGITSPITYTAIPFYLFLTILEKIGFSSGYLQKTLFLIILWGGSISIYSLALNFNFTKKTAALASLFYIFNLNALSIWQRGVHNAMLMLLLAPLTLLFLVWGINKKKYSSIIFINITSVVLAYVFGALGYVFSLWILISTYTIIVLFSQWKNSETRKFIIKYFFLLFFSWLASNAFWIIHLLASGSFVLGQLSPTELKSRGADVLVGLKPYHESSYILRILSRLYLYLIKDWSVVYLNPFFIFLSWVPTLVVFSTTLVKANYKSVTWKFLIILLVIILAISKGINPPLGFLNKIPYDLFAFLAPLRNPYEKVGVLLGIPFSLLFAQGLFQILSYFKEKKINFLSWGVILLTLLSLTILVWPLWLGKLFTSEGRKYAVEIPPYYKEANTWLKEKIATDDTRVLHLPLAWGESIDYSWGYTGVEPSQYFFNGSSIGYQLDVPSVDLRIRDLLLSVHNQNAQNLQRAFASLNIGWVVLHNETVFRDRILEPPDRIKTWFNNNLNFLEHTKDFGPLSIWRVKDEFRAGHFYSLSKLISLANPQQGSSIKIWKDLPEKNDGFLTEVQEKNKNTLSPFIDKSLIYPKGKMIFYPLGTLDPDVALKEVAIVNHLPDSWVYPLITLKETILEFLNQNDQVRGCFSLSGKKLKEAALLQRDSKSSKTNEALKRYEKQLDKCTNIGKDTLSIYLNTDFLRQEILGQLIREKVILDNEFKNTEVLEEGTKAKEVLNEYLADLGLSPKFEPIKKSSVKRIVFNYEVSEDGEYEIKLPNNFGKSSPRIVQIDDQDIVYFPTGTDEENLVFPGVYFKKGFHEIHLEVPENQNLLLTSLEAKRKNPDLGFKVASVSAESAPAFLGEAASGPVSLMLELPDIDVESTYELTFDTDFYQGVSPIVTVTFDNDLIDSSGNFKSSVKRVLEIQNFPIQLNGVKLNFKPPLNSTKAVVAINLLPGGNQIMQNTKALIKNIRVQKVPEWDLYLQKASQGGNPLGSADFTWKKISQTMYEVDPSNQKPPYLLAFSETFHPLWEVYDLTGKRIELPHLSVNGFSNGWLVDKELPDKVVVKFVLQDTLFLGTVVSVVSFAIFSVLLMYLDKKGKNA